MDTEQIARTAVDALVDAGLVAVAERSHAAEVAGHALDEAAPEPPLSVPARAESLSKLIEVVAYLGAALVLAAATLFMRQSWRDLSDAGRVAVLAGAAVALGGCGLLAGRHLATDQIRRRLTGTLLTAASLAAGGAAGVATDASTSAAPGGIDLPGLVGAVIVAGLSAAAYRYVRTAVGLVGILGGTVAAVGNVASALSSPDEQIGVGSALFVVAALWLLFTESGVFAEPTIARALGVGLGLFAAQLASFTDDSSWVGYVLSLVLAGVGVWRYVVQLAWPYLAGAVLAVTLVVPEVVSDWTDGSLGVVGAVMLAGLSLLAGSLAGYRLRRRGPEKRPFGVR